MRKMIEKMKNTVVKEVEAENEAEIQVETGAGKEAEEIEIEGRDRGKDDRGGINDTLCR